MSGDLSAATPPPKPRRLFARSSWPEAQTVARILRAETVGGGLLLLSAVVALVWANSPWSDSYETVSTFVPWPGGAVVGLDLDLAHWAADGLLAVFFFVVGLELKREFVAGELRTPSKAVVPVVAAVGGMLAPAVVFVVINLPAGAENLRGWAIPTATDIAFALAVLAILGTHLPSALRSFLLTLAVADDLFAITIIALFYTDKFSPLALAAALVPIAAFGLLTYLGKTWWWALAPLALAAWVLVHASGVHATIAGVLLGFAVPVMARNGPGPGLAEKFEHQWRPVSAGLAVPVFALFAAGVSLGEGGIAAFVTDPIAIGVVAGLVLGKVIGVFGSTYALAKFTRAQLDSDLAWWDVLGVALLAGIGFTVSLLIGELAFGAGTEQDQHVKAAVLAGSLAAALLAAIVLLLRNRVYRRIHDDETRDTDTDGIPDVYQQPHTQRDQ